MIQYSSMNKLCTSPVWIVHNRCFVERPGKSIHALAHLLHSFSTLARDRNHRFEQQVSGYTGSTLTLLTITKEKDALGKSNA